MDYMRYYKLNNSYTTFVNYTYLNECEKECKGKRKHVAPSANLSMVKRNAVIPPAKDERLLHKRWGEGHMVSLIGGVLTVAFACQEIRFVFPDAFVKGLLVKA